MKKIALVIILLSVVVGSAWGATYYKRSNGTAADKAAASGPCTDTSACMNQSVYSGETFSDGDVIVHCHTPAGIPGKIWSESFVDVSQTLSIPESPTESYALLEIGDKILLESEDSIILE